MVHRRNFVYWEHKSLDIVTSDRDENQGEWPKQTLAANQEHKPLMKTFGQEKVNDQTCTANMKTQDWFDDGLLLVLERSFGI